MLKSLFKSNFVRSGVIFSVANFVVSVIGYLINLLIARAFSLADYGEYMTAMSYVMLMSVPITTLGMIVVQRIGREAKASRKSVAAKLEKWLFSELRSHMPILLFISVLFSILVYFKGNLGIPSIVFILTISLLTLFQALYSASLQAFKHFLLAGLFLISIYSIKLLFSLGVILFSPTLVNIFLTSVLATSIGLFVGKRMIKIDYEEGAVKATHSFLSVFDYLKRKNLILTLITTLGLVGLGTLDLILVKRFLPADQVGLYSSISLLGKIILYVATPLSQVAFSFFTGSDSKNSSLLILIFLTLSFLFIGGVSTGAYFFFPELVIGVIFGNKFLSIGNLIWLAAIFGTLYSLISLYAQYFISKNSWWGVAVFFGLLIQGIVIFFNHSSLSQVMEVNIIVALILLLVLVGKIIFGNFKRL